MKSAIDIADEFKQYAYSVSHDVGAPARTMVQFSRILHEECKGQLDSQGKEYLDHIIESGQRLQQMMNSLLSYSRLMTRDPNHSAINMSNVVSCCVDELRDLAETKKAVVCVDDLPTVYGDVAQVYQLFSILIDNAIRYVHPDVTPRLKIYAMPAGDYWQFHIEDNGMGIPEQFHQKVFMPFSRLHVSDHHDDGIGMGLTIARKIAELHGGSLNHRHAEPSGTDFYVLLPAKRGKA